MDVLYLESMLPPLPLKWMLPGELSFCGGLADSAVKESQQRIESTLRLNGYKWPRKKIIINMAPADIRKEGSACDLPMAAAVLAASRQIDTNKVAFNHRKHIYAKLLSVNG